jgi:hypothetical protein
VVTICTTRLNTPKLCILPTQCICVFRMVLTVNCDYFCMQSWPTGLPSGDESETSDDFLCVYRHALCISGVTSTHRHHKHHLLWQKAVTLASGPREWKQTESWRPSQTQRRPAISVARKAILWYNWYQGQSGRSVKSITHFSLMKMIFNA